MVLEHTSQPEMAALAIVTELRQKHPEVYRGDTQKRKWTPEAEFGLRNLALTNQPEEHWKNLVSPRKKGFVPEEDESELSWENWRGPRSSNMRINEIIAGKRMRMGEWTDSFDMREPQHRKSVDRISKSESASHRRETSPLSKSPVSFEHDSNTDLFASLSLESEALTSLEEGKKTEADKHIEQMQKFLGENDVKFESEKVNNFAFAKIEGGNDLESEIAANSKFLLMLANLKGGF